MLVKSSWQCGAISTGGVAVGLTNVVGIVLGALLYYNHLENFSISIIVISFGCIVLILSNLFLVYGSVHTKPGFVLPWLGLYVIATLAFIVFLGIKWDTFGGYKGASIGAVVFSFYFISVVTELYHYLRHQTTAKQVPEDAEEGEVGTVRPDGTLLLDIDQTDLVLLGSLGSSPATTAENGLPKPEEIINVQAVAFNSKNPFLTDIFKTESPSESEDSPVKIKEKPKPSSKASLLADINADFSPFRNPSSSGGDVPKMKVFLPKPIDCDSDADFSFDTSRAEFSFNDESKNMCKIEDEEN